MSLITTDGCQNNVTSEDEPIGNTVELSPPNNGQTSDVSDEPPTLELHNQDSISKRRARSMTAFLFEEIAGKKLKCYEKWKLWLTLFIVMTIIAIVAIILATVFAVKYNNAFNSKNEAITAQHNLLYQVIQDETANFTDHTDEARKVFNTFDDDNDGIWNKEEFTDHYLLSSGVKTTFDGMDQNGDDILSYKEIAYSIVRYNLSQSYIPLVQMVYNYTFPNTSDASTDALLNEYAANIYLNSYGVSDFGYITREYLYEFLSDVHFKINDINQDDAISFEEYSRTIGDESKIAFLRSWHLEDVLAFLNATQHIDQEQRDSVIASTFESEANICPANANINGNRRRLGIYQTAYSYDGTVTYTYLFPPCEATIKCYHYDAIRRRTRSRGSVSYYGCTTQEKNQILECVVSAFDRYMGGYTNIEQCHDAVLDCLSWANWNDCFFQCYCTCNGECSMEDQFGCRGCSSGSYLSDDVRRRRLGCKHCICGCSSCSSCICFSGDNEMVIKRNDMVHNVLLKDLEIGDYVHTKESEWSKVWFIKKQMGDFEYLKVYFVDNEYITITGDHLVYCGDNMKRADELMVGDVIFVLNSTEFIRKHIVNIENIISSEGAYSPVTMDGSIVVSKVLSSCYAQSPQIAQKLHDIAAVFRWISTYDERLAVVITNFFYDTFFMRLRIHYGFDVAFNVFNVYSTPFIVITTVVIVTIAFIRSVSYFF